MKATLFKEVGYSLSKLIQNTNTGEIGLLDIQRPFVWTPRALQATFRSGIEIEEYQVDPVVRALRMPRAKLLARPFFTARPGPHPSPIGWERVAAGRVRVGFGI